jgi:hypothetical protein
MTAPIPIWRAMLEGVEHSEAEQTCVFCMIG